MVTLEIVFISRGWILIIRAPDNQTCNTRKLAQIVDRKGKTVPEKVPATAAAIERDQACMKKMKVSRVRGKRIAGNSAAPPVGQRLVGEPGFPQ